MTASALLLLTSCRSTLSKLRAAAHVRRETPAPFPPPSLRWFPYLLLAIGENLVIQAPGLPYEIPLSLPGGIKVMTARAVAIMISGALMILAALRLLVPGKHSAMTNPSDVG